MVTKSVSQHRGANDQSEKNSNLHCPCAVAVPQYRWENKRGQMVMAVAEVRVNHSLLQKIATWLCLIFYTQVEEYYRKPRHSF